MTSPIGGLLFDRRTLAGGADVTFQVGQDGASEDVMAHSVVVTAASPVMEAILEGCFREARERRVKLDDVQIISFKNFLELIYTGATEFSIPPCFRNMDIFVREIDGDDFDPDDDDDRQASKRNMAIFVQARNIEAMVSSWRDVSKSTQVVSQIPSGSAIYSRVSRSSGKVEDAWFACRTYTEAQNIAKILSGSPLNIDPASISVFSKADLVLEVAALLDRFSVPLFDTWVEDQLEFFAGWDTPTMFPMMCHAWNMDQKSQNIVKQICKKWCCGPETNLGLEEFVMRLHEMDSFLPRDEKTSLAVRLHLLKWAQKAVEKILDEGQDDGKELSKLIRQGMKKVINILTGSEERKPKRVRLDDGQ